MAALLNYVFRVTLNHKHQAQVVDSRRGGSKLALGPMVRFGAPERQGIEATTTGWMNARSF